jgi:hypothetical protein
MALNVLEIDMTFPNGGGRPRGVRNKFSRLFLEELLGEFEEGGRAAIRICRLENPTKFVAICAALLPKEFAVESVAADLDDDQLDELILKIRERLLEAGPMIEAKEKVEDETR